GLTGLAYQLDQQLGLSSSGDYSTNFQGHQEKWLQGGDAQYFVLPNGELRRWRDAAYSYGAAGLVAKLDATYYADPSKLWDARAIATLAVSGNRLTITPSTNSPGDGTVNVSVSDGLVTTTQTFALQVTNATPTLASVANQTIVPSQDSLAIALSASDADNDPLTYSAQVANTGMAGAAYELGQRLDLRSTGGHLTEL